MLEEIYQTIPHREPFLFIDRIIEVTDKGAIAEREIRGDEPHFQRHYPGNPLMPGVLLCEAVFQTAARIQMAKFKQMVRPGDTIRIETTYKESLSRFHFMRGKVTVDGKLAVTVEFGLALLDADEA